MKTIIITSIILCVSLGLSAQNINDEQLSVDKDYHSSVYKASAIVDAFSFKPSSSPSLYQIERDSLLRIGQPQAQVDISVDPLAYQQTEIKEDNIGHLMMTKGTVNDLSLQGALFHRVDNYFTVAANAAYDSWNERSIDNKFQKDIQLNVLANYYLSDISQVSFDLSSNSLNRGVFSELASSELQDTIRIKSFQSTIKYATFNDHSSALNYSLGISYNTTVQSDLDRKENLWTITPEITKSFNSNVRLNLQSENYLSSNLGMSAPFVSSSVLSIRLNKPKYSLTIGGVLNKNPDELTIYPSVLSNFYFNSENFISAKVSEELSYSGLNAVTRNNPYISSAFINPTITRARKHTVALTNRVTDRVKIRAQLSRNFYFNDINWVISNQDRSLFDIEEVDYNLWSAHGSVDINPYRYIDLTVSLEKNVYDTSSDSFLFYRPEHKAEIEIGFSTDDQKFKMSILNLLSDRQVIDVDSNNEAITSDYRYDVSFNAKYQPFEMLSIELTANNVLNNQFEVLRGYNVFGRNLSASLLFKF